MRQALAAGGRGRDRRLRQRVVLDPGRGPVPAARGRQPHHRRGRGARGRRRGADRVRAAARGPAPGRRGDAGGAPLRGAGVRRRRARRPGTAATGSGRIGTVEETTLEGFARQVAERAAARRRTASGWAATPTRAVRRVAVCGGAGDFLLDAVRRTDADVYVTSDLRHHPASEFLEQGGPALVDVAHWAAEWTWLPVVARREVAEALGAIRWRPGSARCARTHGPAEPHRRRSLKADPAAQLALLDLQELDSRADLLRHQRETLPELAEIAALTASPCRARRQDGATPRSRSTTSPPSRPRSTPTSSRSRPGARATRTGWPRG